MTEETNINTNQKRTKNGLGVAGMVIAIVGACLSWLPVFGLVLLSIGTILSIIALIIGLNKNKQIGMSIAGLVVGIVFGILSVIWTVAATKAVGVFVDEMEQLGEEMEADLEEMEELEDEMDADMDELEKLEDEIMEDLEELEEELEDY